MEDTRFDGLFVSALQNSQGINNFFDYLFSFMRRKTDFFTQDDSSRKIVQEMMEKHAKLFLEDKKKQDLLKEKSTEEKKKNAAKAPPKDEGPTFEEIDDEEANKIQALQELSKKQKEDKKKKEQNKKEGKKEEPKEDGEEDEAKKNLQAPNLGNGGQTDKYLWHQTLQEVTAYVDLPPHTKANQLIVKTGNNDFKVTLKSKPNEPIVDGKWFKKIISGETIWTVERDQDKAKLTVTIEKHEKQTWWKALIDGDIEIDTQKVEPENSKLSDLDGETRQTVEKMMFDQQQKQLGKPTSEESEKQDKLKQFMAAHPEMDFSKAKFC